MTTNNVDHSVDEVYKKKFSLVRFYLLEQKVMDELDRNYKKNFWDFCTTELIETYYDTEYSSLSNLECILMKDTKSLGRYWKFFSFAHDNIFEITTDEKEIHEPLSRILKYDSPDTNITNDLLRPFFAVTIKNLIYIINGCRVQVTTTNYGFHYCTIEKICVNGDRCVNALTEIEILSRKLGKCLSFFFICKCYILIMNGA